MGESNLALTVLDAADARSLAAAFKRGQALLSSGRERERAMLESIMPLVSGDQDCLRLIRRRIGQETDLHVTLSVQLDEEYRRRCAELGCRPQQATLSTEEKDLDGVIPKPVPGIVGTSAYFGGYYEKALGKERLESFGLAADFSYGHVGYSEAHNFIDGRRSVLEIYRAVDSELWSEGYPAAHGITLREVASYMRILEAAGVITLDSKTVKTPHPTVSHGQKK